MKLLLLTCAGGALGAGARFLVNQAFAERWAGFPWATFAVNVAGSFMMGLTMAVLMHRYGTDPALKAFLATGILGGFTTFSAFSFDAVELFSRGETGLAALYVLGSVTLSIAGLVAGMALARGLLA